MDCAGIVEFPLSLAPDVWCYATELGVYFLSVALEKYSLHCVVCGIENDADSNTYFVALETLPSLSPVYVISTFVFRPYPTK